MLSDLMNGQILRGEYIIYSFILNLSDSYSFNSQGLACEMQL